MFFIVFPLSAVCLPRAPPLLNSISTGAISSHHARLPLSITFHMDELNFPKSGLHCLRMLECERWEANQQIAEASRHPTKDN